jgi:hypothetical protein
MEKDFVPYAPSLRLKELGFDEPCFGFHSKIHGLMMVKTSGSSSLYKDAGECLAPTFSQAFRWFREKYDLRIWVESNYGVTKFEYVIATTNPNFIDKQFNDLSAYKTYEEAELACLIKLIEIVKNKL